MFTIWGPKCGTPLRSDEERNKIFEANLGLPNMHALRFWNRRPTARKILCLDDWKQIASMAMLKAASMWDDSLNIRFSTYASKAIIREMSRTLDAGGVIRLPVHVKMHMFKKQAARANKVQPLGDLLVIEKDEECIKEDIEHVKARMWNLTKQQRQVLRKRFLEEKTLEQTGREIGVTKERVRQIILKAVKELA